MAVARSAGMMGVPTRILQGCGLYLPKLDDVCDPRPQIKVGWDFTFDPKRSLWAKAVRIFTTPKSSSQSQRAEAINPSHAGQEKLWPPYRVIGLHAEDPEKTFSGSGVLNT